jgi:hypothetical protein
MAGNLDVIRGFTVLQYFQQQAGQKDAFNECQWNYGENRAEWEYPSNRKKRYTMRDQY